MAESKDTGAKIVELPEEIKKWTRLILDEILRDGSGGIKEITDEYPEKFVALEKISCGEAVNLDELGLTVELLGEIDWTDSIIGLGLSADITEKIRKLLRNLTRIELSAAQKIKN